MHARLGLSSTKDEEVETIQRPSVAQQGMNLRLQKCGNWALVLPRGAGVSCLQAVGKKKRNWSIGAVEPVFWSNWLVFLHGYLCLLVLLLQTAGGNALFAYCVTPVLEVYKSQI